MGIFRAVFGNRNLLLFNIHTGWEITKHRSLALHILDENPFVWNTGCMYYFPTFDIPPIFSSSTSQTIGIASFLASTRPTSSLPITSSIWHQRVVLSREVGIGDPGSFSQRHSAISVRRMVINSASVNALDPLVDTNLRILRTAFSQKHK